MTCLGDNSSPVQHPEGPGPCLREVRLCRGSPVLVDEPAEHVVAIDRKRGRLRRRSPATRQPEVEATMWAAGVVVGEVLTQDCFEVATPEHEHPVEALSPRCPHKAFREHVGPRRPDGGLDDLGPFRPKDFVETGGELRVPVTDEELRPTTRSGQVADQVAGDLRDKAVLGVLGYAQKVSPPGGVLNSEQDVQPLEEHGAYAEEVRGQDPLGLGFEELCPARASPRCWPEAMATEHAPHRCRSDPDAELGQLALDAYTAPTMVLPPQAHDQLHRFRAHRRPPGASLSSPRSPLASSGFSVPTQQRRRCDQESLPAFPRKQPTEGSQEGAVGPPVLDPAMKLALKDTHLVARHNKLDVLVRFAAPEGGHER